jgi:hydroxypyruvate isomerase
MERRNFIRKAALGGVALTGMAGTFSASAASAEKDISNKGRFNLKYAPSLGSFGQHAGPDPVDQIKFMHDQGFRAVFDNGLMGREPGVQEKIASELGRLGMDLGPFVLYADFGVKSMVTRDPEMMDMLRKRMQMGLEVHKRTNVETALVVPGRYDERLHWDYQTANVIESLRMCSELVENSGMKLVIEPLNGLRDHPGLFLTTIPQAYMICKAVEHSHCRIVNDLYHQQITEGNLIPNMDMAWEYIAAFHVGDHPGRQEPGTGEINYRNIFKHMYDKGYDGVICAEHGRSISGKEGESAFIEAYRKADSFEV